RPGPVELAPFSLAAAVGHIARIKRNAWVQQGIEAQIDLGRLERPAWGSEHRVTQVLLNLVTNAEEALQGSSAPRIVIRAWDEQDATVVEVEDNGKGMDAHPRSRIFEPFFTTRQGAGTGLGLSLSYTIVQAHGGSIDVRSRLGAGSTFR